MKYFISAVAAVFLAFSIFFSVTPMGRAMKNNYKYTLQKVDDQTLYETRKKVEDEARAMVASYNSDKLKYEQYNASEDKTQKEWGQQAKMRANNTASVYNNFMLKNNYVFQGNIPADINYQLTILQ